MNFSLVNLGCKVNRVESDALTAQFLAVGAHATSLDMADIIVINTCTVTGEAEKKTRKAVRHALKEAPFARVLVTGCAAAIDPHFFESLDTRVQVIPKVQISSVIDELLQVDTAATPLLRTGKSFPTRVGVKVQDGCNNACTYCIVHVARGKAKSRLSSEILDECTHLARAGVREIVLSGINLGSYFDNGMALDKLLDKLLIATENLHEKDEYPCRFRLSSIEPCDVSDALINLMARSKGRICRHLHLPLQSGSERVLREMARPYSARDYEELVSRIRHALPELSLSTDIIVGFPGETENDFDDTLSLARACAFSKIHVFPYSMRAGTPAAARTDQIAPEVKSARAKRMRELASALRAQDFARRRGRPELVLIEEDGRAMSESYYEIAAPRGAKVGSLLQMSID